MNERIRQLAEQAGINKDAFQFSGTPIKHIVDGPSLEKFAELLVKECITVARGADGLDATHEAWYLIKQHFGVEE